MESPIAPASTTSNEKSDVIAADGQPRENLKSNHDGDAIRIVFDSSNILVRIICYITDGKCHKSMNQLFGVSKSSKRMAGSDML
jgi:hypothetical protein